MIGEDGVPASPSFLLRLVFARPACVLRSLAVPSEALCERWAK